MFRWKTIVVFVLAVAISAIAANYRFGDSAHAIGMLSIKGGKARHPFMITSGKDGYTLIMTGVVLPPYQGDVKVVLEGSPAMNYAIYDSEPVIDLGIHRKPKLEGSILRGVQSRDKLALWVVMSPQSEQDLEALFDESPESDDEGLMSDIGPAGHEPLKLGFYAADSGQKLLNIPILFADLQPEGGSHGSHH